MFKFKMLNFGDSAADAVVMEPGQPPKSAEEIAEAKAYLRQAFADSAGHFDAIAKAIPEDGWQKMANAVALSRDTGFMAGAALRKELKDTLAEEAAEVKAGTPRGEEILDRTVEIWRALRRLPAHLSTRYGPK